MYSHSSGETDQQTGNSLRRKQIHYRMTDNY